MNKNTSAIYSKYIIDGIRYNVSPAQMLETAMGHEVFSCKEEFDVIVDESVEFTYSGGAFKNSDVHKYLNLINKTTTNNIDLNHIVFYTKWLLTKALIDVIWNRGHFSLEDLAVNVQWHWNSYKIGNAAAFYNSVTALTDYIDTLGISLNSYSYKETTTYDISIKVICVNDIKTDNENSIGDESIEQCADIDNLPKKKIHLYNKRKCSQNLINNEHNWLLYIPFDPCDFKLGGSKLSKITNCSFSLAPEISDAHYFLDCYEVVREMVEDGIIKSGITINEGGLLASVKQFLGEDKGMVLDISGIMQSYSSKDIVPVLFSQVPGVIIEIDENDYDYIDAEFLLQDVAYYPIGQVTGNRKTISILAGQSKGVANILQSLIYGNAIEGED